MVYNHKEIEAFWQEYWAKHQTFKAQNNSTKPKYYVLDMFPYPSGAGLHVGHPLGYIASDIVARYKRHKGFNVLHPQGYDSFGLPAEQYAIQTGQHPALTTAQNIARYREQLDKMGFSFDWSREVKTSDPDYYRHTQWIFIQLFNSWYNNATNKAEPIETLIALFETEGNSKVNAACDDDTPTFTAAQWHAMTAESKQRHLLKYRLTYLAETEVNWCPALGTVLANDEIVNGVSERGGHPVIRKKMTQWSMRITAYAERLLQGLDTIDWSESIKESQRNWIGKSVGASIDFSVANNDGKITVFTTRPDTLFGVTYLTLAPEHPLVLQITTEEQRAEVEAYIAATAKRSERDRMADTKTVSGAFTGAYALHPLTGKQIPIWIGDYVLASYGTGAVMAVPAGDDRDYAFAKHFKGAKGMPEMINIFDKDISENAFTDKEGMTYQNSDFLNGCNNFDEAVDKVLAALEAKGAGKAKVNYRLRDAVFSRQRYWGEPFPVYYENGLPQMIGEEHLPILLPEVEKYLPTEEGNPPLGNATTWAWDTANHKVVSNELIDNQTIFPLELNTMPGWAGSSWYWLEYMMEKDARGTFPTKAVVDYWQSVDLYVGGSEHATGHLLYSRFWNKFLKDRGFAPTEEPFKKLINQGMIQGFIESCFRETNSNGRVRGNDYKIYSDSVPVVPDKVKGSFTIIFDKNSLEKSFQFDLDTKISENIQKLPIPIEYVSNYEYPDKPSYLDIEGVSEYAKWMRFEYPIFVTKEGFLRLTDKQYLNYNGEPLPLEDFKFYTEEELGKISKSKYNVVNPDDICEQYGADTLRLYEMFLGPLEQAKPWNTAGISGVYNFLRKLWRLYFNDNGWQVTDEAPTPEMLKALHKTIKKVNEDIENFSFNTSVSQFMICVNELSSLKCHHRDVLTPLAVLVAPFAPHIAEELWKRLGNTESVTYAPYPVHEDKYLQEDSKEYPVSFNGKVRFKRAYATSMSVAEIEQAILADPQTAEQLQGNTPKKIIVVPNRIINIVM
ncbi:class I tRNA ligase family protein [Capnocytophaga sp. oral taxon 336]|uniref:class I tRNA ligase family protein n=1 Tax=Capnocytophaga sp. oral taxon 336 TaxID=712216 RepID=UPI00034E9AC1|nr:class I tRNA ligase family protein [Capnocytophaga sp. oral taxon 336]EPE01590.1 leucine-tRNA ligase [Capnocytophaga sp. oral taxon 336 str. F0502]